jgi:hypothetical protein
MPPIPLPSNLTRGAVTLSAFALGLMGCGGGSTATTSTSGRARTAKLAPAYRAGQYCLPTQDAKYRPAGFECKKHHLARQ